MKQKNQVLLDEQATFELFLKKAKLNPNSDLITGVICGYRIEESRPINQTSEVY
jgi:hypothetical protein